MIRFPMKDADKGAERPVCVHSCCSHRRILTIVLPLHRLGELLHYTP